MIPSRPLLRYHGGKWRIRHWVASHFPPHRIYLEPFGGGGSVLLGKRRSYLEVYNDLDGAIVDLFRILRDPYLAAKLVGLVELTPFAREEFLLAYEPTDDRVEAARRLLVLSFMGHGSSGLRGHKTGFRGGDQGGTSSPKSWRTYPAALAAIVDRLRGVAIENQPAADLIARYDGRETLIYADPPYVFETRSQKRIGSDLFHGYRHEMDDEAHVALLDQLQASEGLVVLSGYASALYDDRLSGWMRREIGALADGAQERTEVLWINPAATRLLGADWRALEQGSLFPKAAE